MSKTDWPTMDDRKLRMLEIIGSAVQGSAISAGMGSTEQIIFEILKEKYPDVVRHYVVKTGNSGFRDSWEADFRVEDEKEIVLFDSKPASENHNPNPDDEIQKYVRAKLAEQALHKDKVVKLVFLKKGGRTTTTDRYSTHGIETVDRDEWLSKLVGRNINVDKIFGEENKRNKILNRIYELVKKNNDERDELVLEFCKWLISK